MTRFTSSTTRDAGIDYNENNPPLMRRRKHINHRTSETLESQGKKIKKFALERWIPTLRDHWESTKIKLSLNFFHEKKNVKRLVLREHDPPFQAEEL